MSDAVWETKKEALNAIASETSLEVLNDWFIMPRLEIESPAELLDHEELVITTGKRMLELFPGNEKVISNLYFSTFAEQIFEDTSKVAALVGAYIKKCDPYICPEHPPVFDFKVVA